MEEIVCSECGFEIPKLGKYLKHTDGTILCEGCFEKLIKKGTIEE